MPLSDLADTWRDAWKTRPLRQTVPCGRDPGWGRCSHCELHHGPESEALRLPLGALGWQRVARLSHSLGPAAEQGWGG